MRKLCSSLMGALLITMLWSANVIAEDVPDCCKEKKACCQDGKACCPKKE